MVVGLSAADGDFVLPAARPERVLLISGGSGITPVMAMLRTLCDEGYAGTSPSSTTRGRASSSSTAPSSSALASAPPERARRPRLHAQAGGALAGHFSREHLRRRRCDARRRRDLRLRPARADRAARADLGRGRPRRAHVESFLPPRSPSPATAPRARELRRAARREVPNSGRSLLEQAEDAGLSPEYGCRMGICHTCSCRKTAGTVRNVLTGEVSTAEDEQIQICVSVPVGDVALDL